MTETTWSARLIHAVLSMQNVVMSGVNSGIKGSGVGRKGKLVILGDDGGTFYLRWDGQELKEEGDDEDVRNTFTMHSQTLLDMATGELGVREAIAARLIGVSGERAFYDEEDIAQLLEQLQEKIAAYVNARGL